MATNTQLAELLVLTAERIRKDDAVINGGVMFLAGEIDDPDSFDKDGGKTGALGYYPQVDVNGGVTYAPCLARLAMIALGGANEETLARLMQSVTDAKGVVDAGATILAAVPAAEAAQARAEAVASHVVTISEQVKPSPAPAFRIRDLRGFVAAIIGTDGVAQLVSVAAKTARARQATFDQMAATAASIGAATIGGARFALGASAEVLKDSAGRAVRIVDLDGTHRVVALVAKRIVTPSLTADLLTRLGGARLTSATAPETLRDAGGRTVRRVDLDGTHNVPALKAKRVASDVLYAGAAFRAIGDKRRGGFTAEIAHIVWYGQSWAGGFDSVPPLSIVQRQDSLTFNRNAAGDTVRQQYSVTQDATALQSFVPAVEVQRAGSPEFGNALGETGAVSAADWIKRFVLVENNTAFTDHSWQLLLSYPGEGSKQIEDLADNGKIYMQRLKEQIARGFAIAQSLGKSYAVPAVVWIQGSSSISTPYADQLEAMRADISAYAKSITGQAEEVYLLTWQQAPNSSDQTAQGSATGVYRRFVGAADTYPYIVCFGPTYQYPQVSATNVHFRATGMREIGADVALAFKRTIVDGVKYQPLRPVSLRRQGKVALLKLNVQGGALVADTTQVLAVTNFGFRLYDSAGAALSITSVAIVGTDTIKLVAADPIPAGAVLRYADTGTDYTDANKWRGNIRDNLASVGQRDRWLVAFTFPFSN